MKKWRSNCKMATGLSPAQMCENWERSLDSVVETDGWGLFWGNVLEISKSDPIAYSFIMLLHEMHQEKCVLMVEDGVDEAVAGIQSCNLMKELLGRMKRAVCFFEKIEKITRGLYEKDIKPNKKGVVYFLSQKGTQLIKIGKAKNLKDRTSTIIREASKACIKLELVHHIECENRHDKEKELHLKYKKYNTHGEWFRFSEDHIKSLEMGVLPQ